MKHLLLLIALLAAPIRSFAGDAASVYDLNSAWTNQRGETVRLADLRGRPRVVCMFFAQCAYACPRITADMKSIQSGLTERERARVGFVMASFDTDRDTPDALREFAQSKNLEGDWQLLHGDENSIRELAAALGVRYRREPDGNFAHSNVITVLDDEGRIVHQREGLGGDIGETLKAIRPLCSP